MLKKMLLLASILFATISTQAKVVNIGFSHSEKKASLHLIQLLKNSEFDRKDRGELKHLLRITKNKNNAFHKYYPNLSEINKIFARGNNFCNETKINTLNADLILKRINRIVNFECDRIRLKQFLRKKKLSIQDVRQILPRILKEKNKHIKLSQSIVRRIVKTRHAKSLESYIIQNKLIALPSSIISALPKTSLLSSYLQTVGYHDRNKSSSYLRSLRGIYRKFRKAIRKKKFSKAKSHAKDAINFYMVNASSFDKKKAWNYFRLIGRSFVYHNFFDEGIEQFKLSSLIADKDQYSESVFSIIWTYLNQDRYDKAYKFIYDERLETKLTILDERLKFWMAKVFQKNGFTIRAKQVYRELIHPKSLNYYSILAKKELSELDKAESQRILASLYQTTTNDLKSIEFTKKEINGLRRYKVFKSVSASSYAYDQLTTLTKNIDYIANPSALKPQANFYYSIIQFLNKENDSLTSFKILMKALRREYFVLDESLLAFLFPNQYLNTIKKHTTDTNPILFLSLIRQESAFNPMAKSRVGARGLMQIMPKTARQYYRRLRASSLNRPSLNLKIGIKYFHRLAKKYGGNLIYTLAAYNAGEGRVKRWKKNIFKTDDPLLNIESIPFNETQNYVKLIYRNIFFYQYLANSTRTLGDVEDSFKISHYSKNTL